MLRPRCLLLLIVLLACWGDVQGGAPDFTEKRWDSPIPYTFDDQYYDKDKEFVRGIIQRIKENTCIDFAENLPGPQLEYQVNFVETETCYSKGVGDRRGSDKNHMLKIKRDCNNAYVIMHETMHALGIRHTQQRADRDEYVEVAKEHEEDENYFKLGVEKETTDYGIPYEYTSIMHYPDDEYMRVKDREYASSTGGDSMIFNDWKLLNLYYKCNETCSTPIDCQNGGYQHPRKCNECVCPRFFAGRNCQDEREVIALIPGVPKPLDGGWPGNRELFEQWSGDQPMDYDKFERTPARIVKAPEGTRIRIKIDSLHDMNNNRAGLCRENALEIVDDGDLTRVGKRFCWHSSIGHSFVSKTNVIGHILYARPGLGFTANVTFTVEGSPTLPDPEGPLIPTETAPLQVTTTTIAQEPQSEVPAVVPEDPKTPTEEGLPQEPEKPVGTMEDPRIHNATASVLIGKKIFHCNDESDLIEDIPQNKTHAYFNASSTELQRCSCKESDANLNGKKCKWVPTNK